MKPTLALALFSLVAVPVAAQVTVFNQTHNRSGTIFRTAWLDLLGP